MPSLPPGQRRIDWFPSFGVPSRPPRVPDHPMIMIRGAGLEPFTVLVAELAALPRRTIIADLHCVSGWSTTGLRWTGVPFDDFYRHVVLPRLGPDVSVSHVVVEGLDRYRSILALEDLLGAEVLLADRLDGKPLTPEHGAPVRLVSPNQYGFNSTKHVGAIELHDREPPAIYHPNWRIQGFLNLVRPHPRASVWREERHRYLPGWVVRPIYRVLADRLLQAERRAARAPLH